MNIEWLILADAVEVVGSKLYLMGGGWNQMSISQSLPVKRNIGIALAVEVPWNETNQKQQFEIEILDGEGNVLTKGGGQFEVGRPPGVPPGISQLAQMAINIILQVNKFDTYEIVARLPNVDEHRSAFHIMASVSPPLSQAV